MENRLRAIHLVADWVPSTVVRWVRAMTWNLFLNRPSLNRPSLNHPFLSWRTCTASGRGMRLGTSQTFSISIRWWELETSSASCPCVFSSMCTRMRQSRPILHFPRKRLSRLHVPCGIDLMAHLSYLMLWFCPHLELEQRQHMGRWLPATVQGRALVSHCECIFYYCYVRTPL